MATKALLRAMGEAFMDDAERLFRDGQTALDARNAQELRRLAHTVKGSLGYFEARDGHAAALGLELAAIRGDWDAAHDAWEQLLSAWQAAEVELRAFCRPAENAVS